MLLQAAVARVDEVVIDLVGAMERAFHSDAARRALALSIGAAAAGAADVAPSATAGGSGLVTDILAAVSVAVLDECEGSFRACVRRKVLGVFGGFADAAAVEGTPAAADLQQQQGPGAAAAAAAAPAPPGVPPLAGESHAPPPRADSASDCAAALNGVAAGDDPPAAAGADIRSVFGSSEALAAASVLPAEPPEYVGARMESAPQAAAAFGAGGCGDEMAANEPQLMSAALAPLGAGPAAATAGPAGMAGSLLAASSGMRLPAFSTWWGPEDDSQVAEPQQQGGRLGRPAMSTATPPPAAQQ